MYGGGVDSVSEFLASNDSLVQSVTDIGLHVLLRDDDGNVPRETTPCSSRNR
jgi:hypothetical protein